MDFLFENASQFIAKFSLSATQTQLGIEPPHMPFKEILTNTT